MTGSRTAARKSEALAIGFLLAASLGQFPPPANDNGTTFGRDQSFLYIGQSTRREGP